MAPRGWWEWTSEAISRAFFAKALNRQDVWVSLHAICVPVTNHLPQKCHASTARFDFLISAPHSPNPPSSLSHTWMTFRRTFHWNTARADSPAITKSSFLAFACNSTISLQAFCMVITDSSSNWSIVVSTDLGLCWGNIGRQIFNMDCIDWWPELLKTTSGKKISF